MKGEGGRGGTEEIAKMLLRLLQVSDCDDNSRKRKEGTRRSEKRLAQCEGLIGYRYLQERKRCKWD